jgi:hypothetical protein
VNIRFNSVVLAGPSPLWSRASLLQPSLAVAVKSALRWFQEQQLEQGAAVLPARDRHRHPVALGNEIELADSASDLLGKVES